MVMKSCDGAEWAGLICLGDGPPFYLAHGCGHKGHSFYPGAQEGLMLKAGDNGGDTLEGTQTTTWGVSINGLFWWFF